MAWGNILKEMCAAVRSHEAKRWSSNMPWYCLPFIVKLGGKKKMPPHPEEPEKHAHTIQGKMPPRPLAVKWQYCLAKASLFFFVLSVRRGYWAALLDGIFSFSLMGRLMCFIETAATSGTCSLMSPAVAVGFFLTNLSRTFMACFLMTHGHSEPIFLSGI